MKLYTAKIEDVIKKNNEPTFELRIRVPQFHGGTKNSLISIEDLPIAKPTALPGLFIDKDKFLEVVEQYKTVRVYLDNKLNKATYVGFINNEGDYIEPADLATDFNKIDGGIF